MILGVSVFPNYIAIKYLDIAFYLQGSSRVISFIYVRLTWSVLIGESKLQESFSSGSISITFSVHDGFAPFLSYIAQRSANRLGEEGVRMST